MFILGRETVIYLPPEKVPNMNISPPPYLFATTSNADQDQLDYGQDEDELEEAEQEQELDQYQYQDQYQDQYQHEDQDQYQDQDHDQVQDQSQENCKKMDLGWFINLLRRISIRTISIKKSKIYIILFMF